MTEHVDPAVAAAAAEARKAAYDRRVDELSAKYGAEIEAMKTRHAAERAGLLAEVEAAFARLRDEERESRENPAGDGSVS